MQRDKPKNRIKEFRDKRGWSQFELGMKLKNPVPPQTVSSWERGSTPSGDYLIDLADLFEVHPRELFYTDL